jgi:hypothetical protein
MLGVSTAAYAISLAGVAANQSHDEASLAAAQAPTLAAIDGIIRGNDRLGSDLQRAGADYSAAASGYATAGDRLQALEGALTTLADRVAKLDGVSRTLPTSVSLPRVSGSVTTTAPVTHATTGASGG